MASIKPISCKSFKPLYSLLSFLILLLLLTSCIRSLADQKDEEIDHHIYVSGSLNQGETLAQALLKRDLRNTAVYPVLNKLNTVFNLRRCQPADSFFIKLDTLDVIHKLTYYPVRDRIVSYSVIRDTSGTYHSTIDTLQTEIVLRKVDTTISGSLYASVRALGEGPHLIVNFTEIFQWDFDFFIDTREGDRIAFVYEQYMINGVFVKYGSIVVAEYDGVNYKNRAYRYTDSTGSTKYYNKEGNSYQKAFLRSPLNYTRISSRFSPGRYHPVLKIVRPHNGVDYAAPTGTPVVAAADGVVSHVGWKGGHPTVNGMSGGYGKTVMIRHTNGYETLYGHLSGYAQGIRNGVRVKQNQVVGYVGQTGLATGSHLHYTVYLNNVAIDPLRMNNEPGPPVPKNELDKFKLLTEKLDNYIERPVDYFLDLVLNQ